MDALPRAGGIVLAGGRSSRMGAAKAALEWHGSTLLSRVAGILLRSLDGPVVIVRAPGQPLPPVPPRCRVVEDRHAGRGPLEALSSGLGALTGCVEEAFVSSTDAPLLHPAFVAAVLAGLDPDHDICVPVVDGSAHPLAAAYRVRPAAGAVAELLAGDQLRVGLLLDRCSVRRLGRAALLADERLARLDPRLDSLGNLNRPGDYVAARARPAPQITVSRPGTTAIVPLRAATLGQAAHTAGVALGPAVSVTLNGRADAGDPQTPLVDGDVVGFGPAPGE